MTRRLRNTNGNVEPKQLLTRRRTSTASSIVGFLGAERERKVSFTLSLYLFFIALALNIPSLVFFLLYVFFLFFLFTSSALHIIICVPCLAVSLYLCMSFFSSLSVFSLSSSVFLSPSASAS